MNRLSGESSPYLLQHQHNPVWWYPWGVEAFEAARAENKPIFLSIGYSTCYWCHVMEQDSFERTEVAQVLNREFISVKVDREERPDIDNIYMDAVIGISGHGGWPMSVFLTPDLKPFWGGTFFYRAQFIQILESLARAWREERERVIESAQRIREYLAEAMSAHEVKTLGPELFKKAAQGYEKQYDPAAGGFGSAPKFPPSLHLRSLLRAWQRERSASGRATILRQVTDTLNHMAQGGIYDHLGGGFHRYSTDAEWKVPHFEKMLYDNALLAYTYVEAFQATGERVFADIARETLQYVLRDMTSCEGGFYSAEDAGAVGREGEFYVWKADQLRALLGRSAYEQLQTFFPISEQGNFEHQCTVLTYTSGKQWSERGSPAFKELTQRLLDARSQRVRPSLDDKILTSWNALMITALTKAYRVLGNREYLEAAVRATRFISSELMSDGKLFRSYRSSVAHERGCLDDYAFFVEALLNLYQCDFDESWLHLAVKLQSVQDAVFWDSDAGGYFYTEAPEVIVRKKDWFDNATPSANAVAAHNLLLLHALYGEDSFRERAERVFKAISAALERSPWAFPRLMEALDLFLAGPVQAVIVAGQGSLVGPFLKELWSEFLPRLVVAVTGQKSLLDGDIVPIARGKNRIDGQTTVYICRNNSCLAGCTDLAQAIKSIRTEASSSAV